MAIDPPEIGERPPRSNSRCGGRYLLNNDVESHSGGYSLSTSYSSTSFVQKYMSSTALVLRDHHRDPPTCSDDGGYSGSNVVTECQLVKRRPNCNKNTGNTSVMDRFDNEFRMSDHSGNTTDDLTNEFDDDEDVSEENYRRGRECNADHDGMRRREDSTGVNQDGQELVVVAPSGTNHDLALVPHTNNHPKTTDTPDYNGYQHNFITVKDEHRFLMLYTFLKRNVDAKIVIYFSTTKSTQYYAKLLARLKFDVTVIHNGSGKEQFLHHLFDFSKRSSGILCLPDFQGGEFAIPPSVQWIVQFEPPGDPAEYIFRVGRISSETAHRYVDINGTEEEDGDDDAAGGGGGGYYCYGKALLFLTPQQQLGFLQYYRASKCKIYEYEIHKISNVQKNFERLIKNDEALRKLGKEAYHAYLLSYASHEYRDVYNVYELEEDLVALAFGFSERPGKIGASSSPSSSSSSSEDRPREKNQRRTREKKSWKPVKVTKDSWLPGEKTWRYADRHASSMKGNKDSSRGDGDVDNYKPSSIKCR